MTNASGVAQASSSFIGNINPIRYRGYYYDTDLGLYYLQSRYYDPETGRFVNVDNQISTGDMSGLNLFAYCGDDPVNNIDPTGHSLFGLIAIGALLIGMIVGLSGSSPNDSIMCETEHDANRRPNTGKPGSTYRAPNGDTRTYGPDGNPEHDYDHSDHGRPDKHPSDSNGGHNHDWENGKRGPAYVDAIEPILGVTLVTVCVIGTVVIVADNATGIGLIDDLLLVPLSAGIEEGIVMIFG